MIDALAYGALSAAYAMEWLILYNRLRTTEPEVSVTAELMARLVAVTGYGLLFLKVVTGLVSNA